MSENTIAGRRPRRLRRGTAVVGMTVAVALGGLGFAAGAVNAGTVRPARRPVRRAPPRAR